jgi:predicted small integral membrane protein
MLRTTQVALLLAVALYYALVIFNNLTDYNTNYLFVQHVLMMNAIFPGNHQVWRAVNSRAWQTAFYLSIIGWELLTLIFSGWGGLRLLKFLKRPPREFQRAKHLGMVGLTLGLLMWLVPFLSLGGEWFLMWQSKAWNGQEAAFRMFTVLGIVLLVLAQPDAEAKP